MERRSITSRFRLAFPEVSLYIACALPSNECPPPLIAESDLKWYAGSTPGMALGPRKVGTRPRPSPGPGGHSACVHLQVHGRPHISRGSREIGTARKAPGAAHGAALSVLHGRAGAARGQLTSQNQAPRHSNSRMRMPDARRPAAVRNGQGCAEL